MDKGATLNQAKDYMDNYANHIDYVKLGFGTAIVSQLVHEKIKVYQNAGVKVYLGGTLLEAFIVRNQFQDYVKLITDLGVDTVEVSDGSIEIDHKQKCEYISELSQKFRVLSEVGSKEEGFIIHPVKWVKMMVAELAAGSHKVIAEARESGTVGIFHKNGSTHNILISRISSKIDVEKIIWETPQKAQQVHFINLFGANVNLGNISFEDVIPLATLRIGLRGDTFYNYLPKH